MRSRPEDLTARPLPDLTQCDREPIHTPGNIQPCGVLLATRPGGRTISHISENFDHSVGLQAKAMLGTDLMGFVGAETFAVMEAALSDTSYPLSNVLRLTLPIPVQPQRKVLVHRCQDRLIIELEAAPPDDGVDVAISRMQQIISFLRQALTVDALCDELARQIRQLVGYDRVMVYRFDESGQGTVIAEQKPHDLLPFLHLRYPASDIPQQARRLYEQQRVRFVSDVDYRPVRILSLDQAELDMSFCSLRGISPVHLEYLRNMGVGASLSISLLKDDRLWGLIACHHKTPRMPSPEMRALCDLIGQFASVLLQRVVEGEALAARLERFGIATKIRDDIDAAGTILQGLCRQPANLLNLVRASGVFIRSEGTQKLIGQTPPADIAAALVDTLVGGRADAITSLSDAGKTGGIAAGSSHDASGILAMPLANRPGDVIAWFRPEVARTVTWAGDPNKPVKQDKGDTRISPRQSFAAWTELVRGHSTPWTPADLSAAEDLHRVITRARLRHAERQLAQLSAYDPLTGIANRRTIEAELKRWQAEQSPDKAALLFFDIDRFKTINDTLGHEAGDQCLLEIAARLRRLAPEGSIPGRLGGDEFVLFWPSATRAETEALARTLVADYTRPFTLDGRPYFSSASIGISYCDFSQFSEMLAQADAAMYAAKRSGGGKAVFFQPELHKAVLTGMQVEQDLFHALNNDQIEVFYQPIVRVSDGVTLGFEALARWRHPERGIILPGEFITQAEASGLIGRIGMLVAADATRRVNAWRQFRPGLTISVNVSARQLTDGAFATWLPDTMAAEHVEPGAICLEVTESALLEPAAVEQLTALRARGFRIAVDDFGTGQSSLSYLHKLPVDIVKIDRSFVTDLGSATAGRFFSAIEVDPVRWTGIGAT